MKIQQYHVQEKNSIQALKCVLYNLLVLHEMQDVLKKVYSGKIFAKGTTVQNFRKRPVNQALKKNALHTKNKSVFMCFELGATKNPVF